MYARNDSLGRVITQTSRERAVFGVGLPRYRLERGRKGHSAKTASAKIQKLQTLSPTGERRCEKIDGLSS
jgi:hypothetical protein